MLLYLCCNGGLIQTVCYQSPPTFMLCFDRMLRCFEILKFLKSEVRKSEVRKSEVRKSEVRSPKSEVRKSEVRKSGSPKSGSPEVRKSGSLHRTYFFLVQPPRQSSMSRVRGITFFSANTEHQTRESV